MAGVASVLVLGILALPLRTLIAQVPEPQPSSAVPLPARPVRVDTIADSLKRPPLSPRRAFLTSLLIPGAAQSRLDRPTASALFAVVDIIGLGMARKSAQDVREAERAPKDSVVATYTIDPVTGVATPATYLHSRFTPARIRARHLHYEDWIALLIFNHIIAATDAYVAAHLWDFKANVSMSAANRTASVSAQLSF